MIGSNIKRIRQKKHLTQQALAEKLGVSRQAICLWESDKREVRASALKKIASVLKVNVNELVKVIGDDKTQAEFKIKADDAKEVFLLGSFNNWAKKVPLRRLSNGIWCKKISLQPGRRYEYKFFIDGEWRVDPENDNKVFNAVGTYNSVKEL
ncbi:MAG: helix-turn-helix domain-containing protein [Candidatus Omnitrophota bacterium]